MTPSDAKVYLIQCIVEEAQFEECPLSDREIKLLRFTESNPTEDFSDLGAEVDETFEHGITTLLRNRYLRARSEDKGEAAQIRVAVKVLKKEDHYLNVMAGPALDRTKNLSITDTIMVLLLLFGAIFVAAKVLVRFLP